MTLDLGGVIRQLRSDHVRGGSGRVLTPPPPPPPELCGFGKEKRNRQSKYLY